MKKLLAVLLFLTPALCQAQAIRIATHNGATTGNGMRAAAAPANQGTVVKTDSQTWNNVLRNGGTVAGITFAANGLDFSDFPLLLSDGTASGASLAMVAANSGFFSNGWGAATSNKDWVMMEGVYNFTTGNTVTVTGIPAALTTGGYTVTLYGDTNDTRSMHYLVSDGGPVNDVVINSTPGNFAGTFTRANNFATSPVLTGTNLSITFDASLNTTSQASLLAGLIIQKPQPIINSFNSSSPTAAVGTNVTLSWNSVGFTTYSIDQGVGDVTANTVNGVGSISVPVNAGTTWTLTASGPGGTPVETRSVSVLTSPATRLFAAVPSIARTSANVRLAWRFPSATTLTISNGTTTLYTAPNAASAASGSTVIPNVTADTTFTATAGIAGAGSTSAMTSIDIRNGADPVSLEETILADNPSAYYRFEETASSAVLVDHSPNAKDSLQTSGGLTQARPGAVGSAWDFANGAIETGLDLNPAVGSMSFVWAGRVTVAASTHSFISLQDGTGTAGRNIAQIAAADGTLSSWLGGGRKISTIIPALNDWCYFALVYDRGLNQLRFYSNGVLTTSIDAVNGEFSDGRFILGASKAQNGEQLRGGMDEVAIFNSKIDDPNNDGDLTDSRLGAYYTAYVRDAAPLLGFRAASATILQGDSVNLIWRTGAAATTIALDNGIGNVIPLTTAGIGTASVSPAVTTTYTLTVNGNLTRQVIVTVTPRPTIPSIASVVHAADGSLTLQAINLTPAANFRLYRSFNLVDYFPDDQVFAVVAAPDGSATFRVPFINPASQPKIFYRVYRELP